MNTLICCKPPEIKPPTSITHKVKRFIRVAKQLVAPTHCRIRFDSMAGKWAVLKDDNTTQHHFNYGVMTNVVFTTKQMNTHDNLQCKSVGTVGIAEGDLRENFYGNDVNGFSHLSFDGNSFVDEATHKPIERAAVLRLMTERRALYK